MRSPVKYSKWEQKDEPDHDTPNPWFVFLAGVGVLFAVFGLLALVGAYL